MDPRLEALFRGAGQGATAGWGDELAAGLLDALPFDDGTGIPREYAKPRYEQYRDEMRADNAASEAAYPKNYMAGNIAGALPGAIATAPIGGTGTLAARTAAGGLQGGLLGALGGAGASEGTSAKEVASDAAKSAALGGALGVAAPGAVAGVKGARELALKGLDDGLVYAMPPAPGGGAIPTVSVPKPGRVPTITDAEADLAEKRLRQTEASWAKKHADRFNPQRETAPARRPVRGEATMASTGGGTGDVRSTALAPLSKPAPRPTLGDRPLIGPQQMSDERILELARAQREATEAAGQRAAPPKPVDAAEMNAAKDRMRAELRGMAKGGNVVEHNGAVQVLDSPFLAGQVREYQKHAVAAEAAGNADQAQWFREKIEEILSATDD